ncbi:hypothetical protein FPOA_04868 [Fusarium poae]|uniref:Uncharacterized protein n=1 Tax=Fusarium poae TaxID=36050 RepID=A0A1B8AUV6_FUSPO|nr:hypothetical protein FPOA_04868 [Fusarium poae]
MSAQKRSASLDETQPIEESHPAKVVKTSPSASQANNSQQVTKEQREQTAKMLYDDTIKMIDKNIHILDGKVVGELGANPRDYTTEDYAKLVCRHSKTVKAIAPVNNTLAFNLVLTMADASHADLDTSVELCGENESTRYFQRLDNWLLQLIKSRERPTHLDWQLPEVPVRWSRRRTRSQDAESDEDPDEWSEPDLGHQYWEKCNYEHNRRVARRRRREITDDWVTVALSDLKEERDYLEEYGMTGFFPKSIAKLEMIHKEMSTYL